MTPRRAAEEVLARFARSAPGAAGLPFSQPAHSAISRVWMVGDRWVLRARVACDRFARELELLDEARPLLACRLPDPIPADDGRRFVEAGGLCWTMYETIPGWVIRPWQDLDLAPEAERLTLIDELRALHEATAGRLRPADSGWWADGACEKLAQVRAFLDDATCARVEAAIARVAISEPAEPRRLCFVHGDFHWGNIVVGEEARVAGLIDLDWARVADPAEDLAYTVMMLVRDNRGDGHRLGDVDRYLGRYGVAATDRARFRDHLVLATLFDVHLFANARNLPGREAYLGRQLGMLERVCGGPA